MPGQKIQIENKNYSGFLRGLGNTAGEGSIVIHVNNEVSKTEKTKDELIRGKF